MKKKMFFLNIYLVLIFFAPLALIPSSGNSALLSSRGAKINTGTLKKMKVFLNSSSSVSLPVSTTRLSFLSDREARLISGGHCPIYVGGEDSSPLSTNETAAIILTLIILGVMVGFVSQDH